MKDGNKTGKQKQPAVTSKSGHLGAAMNKAIRAGTSGKSSTKARKPGGPGPQIVRAWFDTVINPLLDALRTEHAHTERKNWTWRWRNHQFELLHPVEEIVDVEMRDNLVQLMRMEKAVKSHVLQHDSALTELARRCERLQEAISSSPNLQNIFKKATAQASLQELGVTLEDMFGGYPVEDQLGLVTQYIINRTPQLSDYYTVHQLWNEWREKFIRILDEREMQPLTQDMDTAGTQLQKAIARLMGTLEKTRDHLSLMHDVPYRLPQERNVNEFPWGNR